MAQERRGEERRRGTEEKRREELCWKFDVLTIKERIRRWGDVSCLPED